MKNAKSVLLAVTAAFLLIITGIFIGRNGKNHDWVLPATAELADTIPQASQSSSHVGKLDINTATASQFTLLPGIGEKLAQRIVDYRTQNGSFSSVDGLMQVSGIGEKKLDSIRQYLTVGG